MSIAETKDFKHSLYCLDCAYEDLGYNGAMLCHPRTRGCKPIYPYDLMIKSRIRKTDLLSSKNKDRDELRHTGQSNPDAFKIIRKD